MIGIEGKAADIAAVTVVLRSKANLCPDPADLLGILPYSVKLEVSERLIFSARLDSMLLVWRRRALVCRRELVPPFHVEPGDVVKAYLDKPPDAPPHDVTRAGLKIMAGVETTAEPSPSDSQEIQDFFSIIREAAAGDE